MTRLLVSVRSAAEADAALEGGADILDVKEPSRGALGRADDAVIQAIVERATRGGDRVPVTAALGEWWERPARLAHDGVWLAKVGLAGAAGHMTDADAWLRSQQQPSDRLVLCAYADSEPAQSPSPRHVLQMAIACGCPGVLVDTWGKDGGGLFDWLTVPNLAKLCGQCHDAGLFLALAGSIGLNELRRVAEISPDIVAVRGAACHGGNRNGVVDAGQVRRLAEGVHSMARKSHALTLGSRGVSVGK